jgi:hypothetical protein
MRLPKRLTASGNVLVLLSLMYFITYGRQAGAVPAGQCGEGSDSADFKHVADLPLAARCGLAASLCQDALTRLSPGINP